MILIRFALKNETFNNFSQAQANFANLCLQGLQKGLASGGASRLRLHIPNLELIVPKIARFLERKSLRKLDPLKTCCLVSQGLSAEIFEDA